MIKRNYNDSPVYSLQNMLRVIGNCEKEFPSIIPDGIYGYKTEKCIRMFQENNNLKNTGVTDNETWDKVRQQYNYDIENNFVDKISLFGDFTKLQYGMKDISQLLVIQAMIVGISKELSNVKKVEINGNFDEEMVEGIKNIQKISGLEATGIIDNHTYNALCGIYYMSVVTKKEYE